MDSTLAVLIGTTAAFAGAVAYLHLHGNIGSRRAGLAAAGASAAVTATFLLMLQLAAVSLPAVLGLVALTSGATAYLTFAPDLGPRRAALAAGGAATVITASFLAVLYLAVIAFIAAVGAYLLLRTRLRIAPSMILMGTTLTGLLAAAALAFWASLTYAM